MDLLKFLAYFLVITLTVCVAARPQQKQRQIEDAEVADDLEASGGAADKDLKGSASYGIGYYSSGYYPGYYGGN